MCSGLAAVEACPPLIRVSLVLFQRVAADGGFAVLLNLQRRATYIKGAFYEHMLHGG